MILDQLVQEHLAGKATPEQQKRLLDALLKFYNELLIWINDARTREQ